MSACSWQSSLEDNAELMGGWQAQAIGSTPRPRVGGQHADYIVAALQAYRAGLRSHKTMRAQADSLSDQDMADIAAYFAKAGGE